MPNKHAAIKDLRKSKKRTVHNARIRSNVKFNFKQVESLIKEGKLKEAKVLVSKFQQIIDKAVKTQVIDKNRAGKKKAKLMKMITPAKK